MKRFKIRREKPKKYFVGEEMTCIRCGRVEKSDPYVSSDWTVIELEGKPLYVCPQCFGNRPTNRPIYKMPK